MSKKRKEFEECLNKLGYELRKAGSWHTYVIDHKGNNTGFYFVGSSNSLEKRPDENGSFCISININECEFRFSNNVCLIVGNDDIFVNFYNFENE